MSQLLWKLSNVTLSGRPRPRLDRVTVDIPEGTTAILGHSGAGKTSLLNLLVDFERPDRGSLGRQIGGSAERLPVFWGPPDDGLWPHLTVGEHLQMVAPPGASIDSLLADFDLADKMGERPDLLSQGERARLAVARALASDARVLVLDEPLVHVDPARSIKYWKIVRQHLESHPGTSLVFSTHAPEVVLREAQQVVCLEEGRVTYSGPIETLYREPPGSSVAWCLGPVNWFGEREAARWLSDPETVDACLRPEQLAVTPAAASPLVVKSAHFAGSVAEVDLLDERSGETRRFYHRPSSDTLRSGDRVLLRVLALLLVCLLLTGCGGAGGAEPALRVQQTVTWALPAEGPLVPAPRGVLAADGELFVLDNVGRVLVYDEQGKLLRHWWMPEYSVGKPEKLCLFRDGRLAVADTHYSRVVFFDREGNELGRLGSYGRGSGQFIYPVAIAEDDAGYYYVCEYGQNDRIQKFTREGTFVTAFGSFGTDPGQFQRPSGIVWREGKIFVADAFNDRIQVFSDKGEFLEVLGAAESSGSLHYPYDIAAGPKGDFYVVEYSGGRVTRLDGRGRVVGRYGTTGQSDGQFLTPWGLTVDSQGRVFVADTGNRRIVKLDL